MTDSLTGALFHESVEDALREVVLALGGSKAVGARMRPDLPADQAGRWLSDCLNADRRETLHPSQVVWLLREGRAVNAHAAARFLMLEAGYAAPVPVEPEDERAALQREFVEATKALQSMAARLDRLNVRAA